MTFKLYPEERHWWSFQDYQAVLDVMGRTGAKRVLEFGPGSSTLALIEGGATYIDACEDDEHWARRYEDKLVRRFPEIVRMRRYLWTDPIGIQTVDSQIYDLALIDGPRDTTRRPVVLQYALARCRWVFMATEELGAQGKWLRPIISNAAEVVGGRCEFIETGPLSGAFALVGPMW